MVLRERKIKPRIATEVYTRKELRPEIIEEGKKTVAWKK